MNQLRPFVFWPPFLVLIGVCGASLANPQAVIGVISTLNTAMMNSFGWLFSVSALLFFGLCLAAYVSPLGRIRLGGAQARPFLSRWRWFAVTLCTTIATGILFWGTAEPLFHLHAPPPSLAIEPNSRAAARFAVSTMYMHWSLIPYGMYTLAGLMFALVYHNLNQPFSLGSMLFPVFGHRVHRSLGTLIDSICLFCLVAGMSASLGAGILIITGGLQELAGISYSILSMGCVAAAIVLAFVASAASGLLRGIRILSEINLSIFILLGFFMFVAGPTTFLLSFGAEAMGEYLTHFLERSLLGTLTPDVDWARSWTIFNWTNWLAWTPITALFLGKIARGYTVRQFIVYNLFLPALFACLWIMVFSGTSIHMDLLSSDSPLYAVLNQEGGASRVIFSILNKLPLSVLTSVVFFLTAFLSYVTAADSNTSAMSGISVKGLKTIEEEPPFFVKAVWGILIGLIAWIMVSFAGDGREKGLEGVKILSNLGGFPALVLLLLVAVGMVKCMLNPGQFLVPDSSSAE
ncbi:BCCT family transporter [Arundinibacter roseus]|uniref:BCCT family transporter n=1 Tax=Arundinibacter roseus TaxID=2070510 RepID=A0A4R4KJZ4_9BACT|nr:BCCT family transporter [Arundinibacter roseus]TDB66871.1 BCCT family transporter [Arundinibacter roseus]